jgi:hypothetical protein
LASPGKMEECTYYSTRWLHEDLGLEELQSKSIDRQYQRRVCSIIFNVTKVIRTCSYWTITSMVYLKCTYPTLCNDQLFLTLCIHQNAIPVVHHDSPLCHLKTSSTPLQHHHPSLLSAPKPRPLKIEIGTGSNNHTPPLAKSLHNKCAVK